MRFCSYCSVFSFLCRMLSTVVCLIFGHCTVCPLRFTVFYYLFGIIKSSLFHNQTTNVHYYTCNHCLSLLIFRFHMCRGVCDTFSFPFLQVHWLSPSITMAVTIPLKFLFKKCIILALLVFNLKKNK